MFELDRRTLLVGGAALLGCGPSGLRPPSVDVPGEKFETSPFTYGVASGDPLPDAVVLWTALSNVSTDTAVGWELAEDELFARIAKSGVATVKADDGFTLHVDATGLSPATQYFYRFVVPGQTSTIGRTRTVPAAGAALDRLRFGVGCCQDKRGGYYTAHRHAAEEQFDLFFFVGDYMYERNRSGAGARTWESPEPTDLAGYRARYAELRGDADLQANHASCAWVVTWDDHEVVNNYAGPEHPTLSADALQQRRVAAYRAYSEWMPIRTRPAADGSLALYRGFTVGDLLDVSVLDTRQYRSGLVCGGGAGMTCPEWGAEDDTILGAEQRTWLTDRLKASTARWNVIAQQVIFSPLIVGSGTFVNHDQWDGYPKDRDRVLDVIDALPRRNTVILTGDIHVACFSRVERAGAATHSAIEIVTNSISSGGSMGDGNGVLFESLIGAVPGWMYAYESRRGYTACEVTHDGWKVEYRIVDTIDTPGGAKSTHATFEIRSDLGVRRA